MSSTKRKTREEFIEDARKIHGDKYDYSKVEYVNQLTEICIICPKHGEFWQKPKLHLRGYGCSKCSNERASVRMKQMKHDYKPKGKAFTNEEFIKILKAKYDDKYDYSKVVYVNRETPITLICPKHGEFSCIPHSVMRNYPKHICPKCAEEYKRDIFSLGRDEFIKRSSELFHGKYSYDNVVYINNATKVSITCPKHGEFLCLPMNHLHGRGCPICKAEKHVYEERLYNFLKTFINEEDIVKQFKDSWLSHNKSIDFYLPKHKIAIEHQGSQHFKEVKWFLRDKRTERFPRTRELDEEKFNECSKQGIKLLYFSYELQVRDNEYFEKVYCKEDELKEKILNLIKQNKNE